MGEYRKLWFILIGVLAVTFSLLGYFGSEVYRNAPPIPAQVVSESGEVLMTHDSILDGQTAWQSVGGEGKKRVADIHTVPVSETEALLG